MAVSLPRPRREPFLVHEDTLALPSTHAVQPAAHYSMVDLVADLRETRLSTEATRLIHRAAAEGDDWGDERGVTAGADTATALASAELSCGAAAAAANATGLLLRCRGFRRLALEQLTVATAAAVSAPLFNSPPSSKAAACRESIMSSNRAA